jgi:hypothetical protein
MKKTATLLTLCLAAVSQTFSASADSTSTASALGNLLASESFCDMTYNQSAIAAYIEREVAADDMRFNGMLSLMTSGHEIGLQELSPAGRIAHCTQARRVARSHNFIE